MIKFYINLEYIRQFAAGSMVPYVTMNDDDYGHLMEINISIREVAFSPNLKNHVRLK